MPAMAAMRDRVAKTLAMTDQPGCPRDSVEEDGVVASVLLESLQDRCELPGWVDLALHGHAITRRLQHGDGVPKARDGTCFRPVHRGPGSPTSGR